MPKTEVDFEVSGANLDLPLGRATCHHPGDCDNIRWAVKLTAEKTLFYFSFLPPKAVKMAQSEKVMKGEITAFATEMRKMINNKDMR